MKIIEIGTGYTSIPAKMGAATEIIVEELTKAFIKNDNSVKLVDIADTDRLQNKLPIIEVKMPFFFSSTDVQLGIMHKLKRLNYSIALTGVLRKIIKNSNDKVLLHFHNQYNLYFFLKLIGTRLRKKVKIAYTVHSYIWPAEWDEIKNTIKKRYFQEVYCVQNADYVLVLNDKTTEHFVNHLGVKKVRIYKVANGVNTDTYSILSNDEIITFKDSIGIGGKRIIFQVGSVCDRKNQLGAVKTLMKYLQSHRDVVYIYAGGIIDNEYKKSIDKFAEENEIINQVRYVGELCPGEQLNKYYNAAEMTIFPSKIESFGLVIIESLSAGTPVIVSSKPLFDLNKGYSVFKSDEEFIRIVDSGIKGQNKGEKNRFEVVEKYSWIAVAKQHLSVFCR